MTTAPTPAPAVRRGRPGYDRQTLVDLCVKVFNRHGYDATSMGMLATELGISKSAIYHHVKTKEDILQSALTEALGGLEEIMDAAESTAGPATNKIEALIIGAVRVLVEKQPSVTLLLRLRGNSEVETDALKRRRNLTNRLASLIATAQAEESVRDTVDPQTMARLIFGTINSLADWYQLEKSVNAKETGRVLAGLVFHGVLEDPPE
ncbi:MAG: TetR/AcrR family transcriptional regulator [Yaniella sp.]|uniref:TetR/AcrR family transcriptional regulator n=1 Tax=Yaniella sp. TaxID=2773929 RepID=UPI00182004E9|nr:TetR/AcrR family transcriptional regulator [Yaniella sp.]NLZ98732.1 TetR/AcrR family transcriptional regulator [Micrococcus sp.]MDN5704303.1 TetR/AcrR family transcriptional regulator [Yaniella sp.]MDN5731247.1 TetR/AcrR family transcriptional regulator [Yaniella sp.]MDN5814800.1 TetR/AcrR family transcriptional regulator [Yaniella sp.]MDN5818336.1 TetR/AcrR family transcriptional regulator [Yaniella sp.]